MAYLKHKQEPYWLEILSAIQKRKTPLITLWRTYSKVDPNTVMSQSTFYEVWKKWLAKNKFKEVNN